MAKKSSRIKFALVCEVCRTENYISEKNKINTTDSIKLKKYCSKCRKRTIHKEKKKLH